MCTADTYVRARIDTATKEYWIRVGPYVVLALRSDVAETLAKRYAF